MRHRPTSPLLALSLLVATALLVGCAATVPGAPLPSGSPGDPALHDPNDGHSHAPGETHAPTLPPLSSGEQAVVAAGGLVVAADGDATAIGTIAYLHVDTENGPGRDEVHLLLPNGRDLVLRLPAKAKMPTPGARAKAKGKLKGDALTVAAEGNLTPVASEGTVAAEVVAKNVLVIAFNFTTDTRTPYGVATLTSTYFTNTKSIKSFYEEQTNGAWTVGGRVAGYYTISADRSACNWRAWADAAKAKAAAAGVAVSSYTNIAYWFPEQATCGWSGLGYLPGSESWINGHIRLGTMLHELGHNFGSHHAATTSCTSGGVRVPFSATCTQNEYGDPFDVLGTSSLQRHSSTTNRRRQGYLTNTQIVTTRGTYTVGVAGNAAAVAPRLLSIPRGDGTSWDIEYRRPGGIFDTFAATDPVVNGATIRLAIDRGSHTFQDSIGKTRLIDMTPGTTAYTDAALTVGRTFTDGAKGISIRLDAIDSSRLTVTVTLPADTSPPSAPTNLTARVSASGDVTLAWAAATDNVGVTGYRVARDGNTLTTTGSTAHTDPARVAGTYTYVVNALDAAGNASPGASVTVAVSPLDLIAPSAPGTPVVTLAGGGKITLTWAPSTDNVGVTGYRVIRDGRVLATVSGTTYTLRPPKGTSTYTVVAIDAALNASTPSGAVRHTR